jgi:hypothetical protein
MRREISNLTILALASLIPFSTPSCTTASIDIQKMILKQRKPHHSINQSKKEYPKELLCALSKEGISSDRLVMYSWVPGGWFVGYLGKYNKEDGRQRGKIKTSHIYNCNGGGYVKPRIELDPFSKEIGLKFRRRF